MKKQLFNVFLSVMLIFSFAAYSAAYMPPQGIEGAAYATARPYDGILAFGDSLSDNGNLCYEGSENCPDETLYNNGRFSNGDVWVEYLADQLGIPLMDMAFGGAASGSQETPPGLLTQIAMISQPRADYPDMDDSVVTIWIGANDYLSGDKDAQAASDNVALALDQLAAAGVEVIMVLNLPDLGATPEFNQDAAAAEAAQAFTQTFNTALAAVLDTFETENPQVTLYRLDMYSLFNNVISAPADYGFENADSVSPDMDGSGDFENEAGYLFWDTVHPTTEAHELIAQRALAAMGAVQVPEVDDTVTAIDWKTLGVADTGMVDNILQITTNPWDDVSQCWGDNPWGPNGEWVVYQCEQEVEGSDEEICKVRADGTGLTRLTDNDTCDSHASFTPDGKKIVFQRKTEVEEGDGSFWEAHIWIMNADGTGQTDLSDVHADNPDLQDCGENKPVVSPDGTKIAFHSDQEYESIWVMNIDGTNPVMVSGTLDDCNKQTWSPDSQWVLFNGKDTELDNWDSRLYKVKADGTQLTKLSNESLTLTLPDGETLTAEDKCENWAFWSPAGDSIAYHGKFGVLVDPGTENERYIHYHTLSIMAPDGTSIQHLVVQAEDDEDWTGVCAPKSWSPDGNWIAYKMDHENHYTAILALNIETGESIQLTEGFYDYRHWWSPAGDKILFSDRGGSSRDQWLGGDNGNLDDDLLVINLAPWFFDSTAGAESSLLSDDTEIACGDLAIGADVDITDPLADPAKIMLSVYSENPTAVELEGAFWDLFVKDTSNITSLTLKLYLTEEQIDLIPYWFNEVTGAWEAVDAYVLETAEAPYTVDGTDFDGYLAITIDDTTSPALGDLTGTVFAASAAPVAPTPAPSPSDSDTTASSSSNNNDDDCFISTMHNSAGSGLPFAGIVLVLCSAIIALIQRRGSQR